jgi:MFS transporter, putative metabolite:H+ symporter
MTTHSAEKTTRQMWLTVVAVALGYTVDLYNLLLFGTIRKASLAEIGISGVDAAYQTVTLMNFTVGGMFIGGFTWGAFSDRFGRAKILYFSIITFIIANLANAFITDLTSYKICRAIAGFALAGELGTGITLVAEKLPKHQRTTSGAIITACGMLGAVIAGLLSFFLAGEKILGYSSWRFLFVLGAAFGLVIFVFRTRMLDVAIFLNQSKCY